MDDELKEIVTRLYQGKGIVVHPTYPRVLVRVLPKEQETKDGLILTDYQQNKPTHEAIVLEVYKPFWKTLVKSDRETWERSRPNNLVQLLENGEVETEKVWIESPVKIGDHILFPHMALGIIPVWPLDDGRGEYRLIPDEHILGTVEYEKTPTKEWLIELISPYLDHPVPDVAGMILERATVVRTDFPSKTISGR
jgi:co-chaperonin GroES (HSP10)